MNTAAELTGESQIESPDTFYEALIDTHSDLSEAQSHALNARLVLLLANHIGDMTVLREALQAARASGRTAQPCASTTPTTPTAQDTERTSP